MYHMELVKRIIKKYASTQCVGPVGAVMTFSYSMRIFAMNNMVITKSALQLPVSTE